MFRLMTEKPAVLIDLNTLENQLINDDMGVNKAANMRYIFLITKV